MRRDAVCAGFGILIAVGMVACGRGAESPLEPTEVSKTAILSGVDGTPIDASVTDGIEGRTVSAPGFLTLYTVPKGLIYLWPNDKRLTLNDTFQYVYGGNEFNSLERPGDSTTVIAVNLHGVFLTDVEVLDAAREGVDRDNTLLTEAGVNVRFVIGGPGQIAADWYLDPNDPAFRDGRAAAGTYNYRKGHVFTGSKIVVWKLEYAKLAIVWQHELAHTLGLGHSVHPGPMMISPNGELYSHQEFTDLDRDFVRLVHRRQPGTRLSFQTATENERSALQASGLQSGVSVVSCSF